MQITISDKPTVTKDFQINCGSSELVTLTVEIIYESYLFQPIFKLAVNVNKNMQEIRPSDVDMSIKGLARYVFTDLTPNDAYKIQTVSVRKPKSCGQQVNLKLTTRT